MHYLVLDGFFIAFPEGFPSSYNFSNVKTTISFYHKLLLLLILFVISSLLAMNILSYFYAADTLFCPILHTYIVRSCLTLEIFATLYCL